MPNKRKNRRPRRRNAQKPFHQAPLQGMGETFDWIVHDLQSVFLPLTGPGTFGIRGCTDVNGFSWSATQNGQAIGASSVTSPYNQALYGQNNSQFQRLASLWQEYRVDMIAYEFQPIAAGGNINMTSMVSVVDESGQFQGTPPLADVAEKYSSMRNVSIHSPYKVLKQKLHLNKWLGQTQDRSWLQTQEPGTNQIIREVYATPLTVSSTGATVGRTPALGFVGGFNSTQPAGDTVILGVIKYTCKFVFRQRKALTSDPFLDQTLLYMKDGKDYVTKLTPQLIEEIVDKMNLHEELDSISVESEPIAPRVQSQNDLTRSQIISLFQNAVPVERAISTVCHKPAHMKERIGEASNPGPDIDEY